MSYLLDTNVFAELLRPRPNPQFVLWFSEVPVSAQYTSVHVVAELFAGACKSRAPERWLRRYNEDVLPFVQVLGFDLEAALIYGRVRADLEARGQRIADMDLLVAATALRNELTLVTANRQHFERIEGLNVHGFSPGVGTPAE